MCSHKCKITYVNAFSSAIQLYEYKKAIFHKKFENAIKILQSYNLFQVRMHSKDIVISFTWYENSFIEMKQVYLLKINTCPIVKQTLLNTGNKSIIECNKFDKYWANCYTQIQSESFQPNKYIGRN